jgi:hypothetical protein
MHYFILASARNYSPSVWSPTICVPNMSTKDCPNAIWMSFVPMSGLFMAAKWTQTLSRNIISGCGRWIAVKHLVIEDHTVCMGYVDMSDNGKQLQHKQENLEMDDKALLPSVRPQHSKLTLCLQVLWGKYDSSEI